MGSGKLITRAIKKYGIENFTKEILHVLQTEAEMNAKEKELVTEELCQSTKTYNLCVGGHGGFSYINRNAFNLSPKRNLDLGAAKKKQDWLRANDPDWVEKNRTLKRTVIKKYVHEKYPHGIWLGKSHSEESKQKIGAANKGKGIGVNNSQSGTCWVTNGIENKKIKQEVLSEWIAKGFYKGRR